MSAPKAKPRLGWRQVRLLNEIRAGYPICYPGIHPKSRASFVALHDSGLIDVGQGGWDPASLTDAGRDFIAQAEQAEDERFTPARSEERRAGE